MRKVVLFLCLFLINISFSQLKDTIFGKVKSIKEELFFLDKNRQNYRLFSTDGDYGHSGFISNKGTKQRFYSNWYHSSIVHYLNYFKEFNEKGKPTKEIWYYKNGDTVTIYDYVYNKNENLIQIKESDPYDNSYRVTNYSYNEYRNNLQSKIIYYSDSPEAFSYEYYIYDKKDFFKIIEINSYNNEGAQSGIKFIYDKKGKIIKKVRKDFLVYEYFNDGSSTCYQGDFAKEKILQENFYNEKEYLTEIWKYRNNPKDENQVELGSKIKNYFYNNGLLKRKIFTTESDTITSLYEYKYDSKGRIIEEFYVHKRFIKNEDDIIYDMKKIKLDDVKIPDDEFMVSRILKYKYDNNNLIELAETDTFGGTVTTNCKFEYVFDENKNWIEQIKYINGEKLYVWKRKINYY